MKDCTYVYVLRNLCLLSLLHLLFTFLTPAIAQNISNGSNLYISGGVNVYTGGNLTNTGFFQNNGSFSLSGDWLNLSIYQGTGIVSLNGGNQLFSNKAQPLAHLIIDGGGIKSIPGKLFITNEVDFFNGVVLITDNDTLLMGTNCAVKNGSDLSYVDGALTSQGGGYKFYPIGKKGKYYPVELLDIKGFEPTVEVEVVENLPAVTTSIPVTIRRDIYWTRKTIAGTFESSPITLGLNLQSENPLQLVIASADDLLDEFSVSENVTIRSDNELTIISSVLPINGNFFVLGVLPGEAPRPYFFSTTLSPNAMNPDNRFVKVFGDAIGPSDFYFQVFNRWGQSVYETLSFASMASQGWDGRQNGNVLPSGVYPYSIKYKESSGKPIQQTGFITIVQ
ncbi:MAG: gliding motility-associated C-terminal domain-containing protein [Cyclobacteriaceae bacterium]